MADYRLTETRRQYRPAGGEPLTDEEWREFDDRQRAEESWSGRERLHVRHRREHVRVVRYEVPSETPSVGHIANLRQHQVEQVMFWAMLPTEDLAWKATHAFELAYDLHPDSLVEWLEKGYIHCFRVEGRWVLQKTLAFCIPSREEMAEMFRRERTPFDDDPREPDGSVIVIL